MGGGGPGGGGGAGGPAMGAGTAVGGGATESIAGWPAETGGPGRGTIPYWLKAARAASALLPPGRLNEWHPWNNTHSHFTTRSRRLFSVKPVGQFAASHVAPLPVQRLHCCSGVVSKR